MRINKLLELRNVQLNDKISSLKRFHQTNSRKLKIVAHDLRDPISAISALNSLLNLKDLKDQEKIEIANLIESSCQSALSLIHEILDNEGYESKLN